MKLEEAIVQLLNHLDVSCYSYNKQKHTIEKNTLFVHSAVEQSQMLKIVESLDQLGMKYEIDLNGNITLH